MKRVLRWSLRMLLLATTPAHAATCTAGSAVAAAANTASFENLAWAPFRRPETGWAIYAPRITVEIATRCPPQSLGFAAALAVWQSGHDLPATGIFDTASFAAMKTGWMLARSFVRATRGGRCPDPPPANRLATLSSADSYAGKTVQLRADALAAYRRMLVAARATLPARDAQWFRIFSGFRDPLSDDVRCAIDNNCQGVTRAACSAHRTGLAIDLHVGQAPGFGPDSSADANRRAMVQTLAYRWLLTNAGRFGFQNYVFEPWHWEYDPGKRGA